MLHFILDFYTQAAEQIFVTLDFAFNYKLRISLAYM